MFREIFSVKHAALFVASALFVFLFSTSTSPLYNNLGDDSSIFQAVGKGWTQGLLPYVDLFENKGALVFFFDALGYMIYPRVGIMFLQVPMTFLSFVFAWRSLGLFLSGKLKVAAAVFMLTFYSVYSLEGNRTEEWSMPFLMAATYFFLRGLKFEKFSCPPIVGFICGLGFGVCVLLRMMNAAPLCLCAFLSAIFLLQAGEFKVLLKNLLNFCAGAVLIVLPFVIYFAAQGALYEALYGTILLNFSYSAQRENFLMTHLDEYAAYIAIHFMPLYLMIIFGTIEFIKSKNRAAISGIFIGALMLILLMKLSPYQGYCALITPLLPLLFILLKNFNAKNIVSRILIVVVAMYPLLIFYQAAYRIYRDNSAEIREYHLEQNAEMLRLAEIIPPEERQSVMIWSEGTHASHWALTTGIMPRCRFFSNIKAFSKVDANVKDEWFKTAVDDPPQWIIYCVTESEFTGNYPDDWTRHFRQNRDSDVERLLQERYNLEAEMTTYLDLLRLYRLKR